MWKGSGGDDDEDDDGEGGGGGGGGGANQTTLSTTDRDEDIDREEIPESETIEESAEEAATGRPLRDDERVRPSDDVSSEGTKVVVNGRVREVTDSFDLNNFGDRTIELDGEEWDFSDFAEAVEGQLGKELPEPTGSTDPADWNVDWEDTNDKGLVINQRQQTIFDREFDAAVGEDVRDVLIDQVRSPKDTSSGEGEDIHALTLVQANDLDIPEPNIEYEPTEEELTGAEMYTKASREFVRNHPDLGDEFSVWRGLKNHIEDEFVPMVADAISELGEDGNTPEEVTLPLNTITNTTTKGRVSKYTGPARIRFDITPEDVVGTPDAILGLDYPNEDEIRITGNERTVDIDNVAIAGEAPFKRVLENPGDEISDQLGGPLKYLVDAVEQAAEDGYDVNDGASILAERLRSVDDEEAQEYADRLEAID